DRSAIDNERTPLREHCCNTLAILKEDSRQWSSKYRGIQMDSGFSANISAVDYEDNTGRYGVDYIPSVIPVEMSSDGRCLCPTSEQHGACSCIAADWKRVRLQ
ncbi:hypothetical protein OSTOST_13477, partial [Ostertagia ostertagi]